MHWTGWRRYWFLECAARAGYAARGLLYLMVGTLSLLAAVELRDTALGTRGALTAFGRWPAGPVWLFALGLGLTALMLWRLAQAVFDIEGKGASPMGLARRFGQAISGLGYGALGYSAVDLSDDLHALLPGQPGHEVVERILDTAFGNELLLGAGLLILVVALGCGKKALSPDLDWKLGCEGGVRRWAVLMGRAGHLARASVLLLLGGFAVQEAFTSDAVQAASLGKVLQSLEAQPSGFLALAAAGLGLAAYGAFGLIEARYRRIRMPRRLRVGGTP